MPLAPNASAEAAAASAARQVLLHLFPKQRELIEQTYDASIKTVTSGFAQTQGIVLGQLAAGAVIADRMGDGVIVPDTYRPITTPGVWVPTVPPITEQFARAKPWVFKSASQFRPGPPPQLSSSNYAVDYNETKIFGGAQSKMRSPEQTEAVNFWKTPVLAPAWQSAARQFAVQRKLPLAECDRLFALLNMANANSYIADWDAKFAYNFWRPITAIRNGDLDGNDATERDPSWSPLASTPLHPEYPSQASISAGVSLRILEAIFGNNPTDPIVATDIVDANRTRTLSSLVVMAKEHRDVRIWGGIHFRNSLNVAQDMGQRIADYLLENTLRPVR
jgi:hypothetical protein